MPATKKKKKTKKKSEKKSSENKEEKYIEGVGRRKTATARVRIYPSKKGKGFVVNDKKLDDYFHVEKNKKVASSPFGVIGEEYETTVQVSGGGLEAQAGAIRHGLSRALLEVDESWRKPLKSKGYLTRDPRMKERKKPGLRKARRPQQWRKR